MRRKTDDYDYEYEKYRYQSNNDENKCSHCRGSGHVDGERCPACEGRGVEPGYDDEDD